MVWNLHPRAIRRGSFSNVKELIAKIEQFVAAYNKTKAPFNWTATADSILEKLQRLCSKSQGRYPKMSTTCNETTNSSNLGLDLQR